ncbi:hemolysin activation/secretion protein [Kerstersia gyiorum]|uniref:Hemolysin activation/secretion protein n=1 Tax=Kerstersia gyiorum TaxID=206506 RepID=A0A4Q7MF60_9BURK|nr:hemolysin activation/secretion protein [Kerstersia gyiorum]
MAALFSCLVLSQQLPDPSQELQRQEERQRERQRQLEQTPTVRLETPIATPSDYDALLPHDETPCFPISTILLQGDTDHTFTALPSHSGITPSGLSDPAMGRCLGTEGIRLVVSRMQHALVEQGFITTHLFLKSQDLTNSVLIIDIIPGRIHNIILSSDSYRPISLWSAMPARPGDLLNLRDIEQGLENLRRLPSVDANIAIAAAQDTNADGYSDLIVAYAQERPIRLSVSLDDGGSNATGKYQGSLTLAYDNWWSLGDLLHINLGHDLGGGDLGAKSSRNLNTHYSFPWRNWLASFNYSRNDYRQNISGANQNYLYQGNSRQTQIQLSRMIWRNARHRVSLHAKAFQRRSSNYIDDTEIKVQRRRTGGWELGINHRAFLGNATTDVTLSFRRGTGAFGAIPAPEQNFGEGTARFKIINADATLHLPWRWGNQLFQYSATWRAQWNRTPLAPNERFSIGGRYSVRGFDGEYSLMADRGWLLRNELAISLGAGLHQAYGGLDFGAVSGPSSEWLSGRHLAGAVLGLRGNQSGLLYDLFVGVPLHKPPHMQTANVTAGFSLDYPF